MTKNDLYDVALGVALVALGYAVWTHYKGNRAGSAANGLPASFEPVSATNPAAGQSYDSANPGQVLSLKDLLNGTVHDIMGGSYTGTVIPTTNDIFSDVTGYEAPDSAVKINTWLTQ